MKKIFFVALFLISAGSCFAQTIFQQTYGGQYYEGFSFCSQTSDSGYIFGGSSLIPTDGYLVKTDLSGNVLWSKTYDVYAMDGFSCGRQTPDNGYILAGFSSFYPEALIVKTDSAGNVAWSKSYVEGYDFTALSIEQALDGGYILVANTDSDGFAYNDAFLFKIDSTGNFLWCQSYSGNQNVVFNSVKPTSDNGYIIAGWSDNPGLGDRDMLIIKTDSLGNLLWSKSYGGANFDVAYQIYQTADQGYVFTGTTTSFGNISGDAYIIGTDSSGNMLWSKTYHVATAGANFNSLHPTADSGYVVGGYTGTGTVASQNGILAKIDSGGTLSWSYSFGGMLEDWIASVRQTNDGGFIAGGFTSSFGAGGQDGLMIKTDSTGTDICNFTALSFAVTVPPTQSMNAIIVQSPLILDEYNNIVHVNSLGLLTPVCGSTGFNTLIPDVQSAISISPNPTTNNFTITFPEMINAGAMEIYNVLGEKMMESTIFNTSQKEIHFKNISAGIYFVKVADGEMQYTQKLVVQ